MFKNNPGVWNSTADIVRYGGGDCGNLATLFITLMRCRGIPARHVILPDHAWAEFYLKNYGWIPVDPTFHLFGRASSGYDRPVWSNEIVFHVQTSPTDSLRTFTVSKHHLLFPSHKPYKCDIQTDMQPIEKKRSR